jgi:hypothetical protein
MGRQRLVCKRSPYKTSQSHKSQVSARTAHHLLLSLFALAAALYPVQARAQSIAVIQRTTLNQQPSSGGTVTLTLPKTTGAGHALIVGASFWPLDLTSVTDSSGDLFTRGLTTSLYHNVSQGVMYTNFYYAKSTAGGATSLTLHFTGSSTYVVAAVAEVAGLDPSAPLDQSGYHESLTTATPWSSAALTTSVANEYLFAWAADEWNNPTCSNPTAGWTVTQNNSGATLCLLDRAVSTTGSYQATVTPSTAFNYAMEIVGFKGAAPPAPPPLAISTTSLPAGTVSIAYSATLAASGGIAPYTWSASALPSGLSISAGGTISGTPTAAGTFAATVTVMDSSNARATRSFSVAIAAAPAPPPVIISNPIAVIQRTTLSQQPSSGGTVTLTLPKTTGAGHALIVGASFWPLDLTSVTDSSGDLFTRGLTTSLYHNVSQGVMYTNFYYAKSTAGGATSLTLHFTGSSTYVVAAVAEVSGLDPSAPLDQSGYHEALSSATPWSSAALATSAANEYLFAWAADEWNNPTCSNPTAGWTVTQNNSVATLCLLDRAVSATGSYQATVTPSVAFNYAMEIVGFKGAATASAPPPAPAPPPLTISTATLPAGTVGTAYSATLAATGGVSPYTWSASALPGGLFLSASGVISGIPTTVGTQLASLTVRDSSGAVASASFSIAINSSGLPPRPATTFSLLHFGNAGFGGDDTNVFQTALNYTAANAAALEIPAGSYHISPISFPANSYVIVDANVTVTANSGYGTNDHLLNVNAQNVAIIGAGAATSVFHMLKAQYTSGEWRHCLDIENAANVTISGISCNDSGGDGVYLRASSNVTIEDSIFNNNRRQGSSITGQVNHVYFLRDHFTNTIGTAPQSGIDVEPNGPGDYLLDVNIDDCYTDGNAGDGLMVSLWLMTSASQPVGVTVLRHHSTGNRRYGYVGINNDPSNAPGAILIKDSFSDQSGSAGAAGRFFAANGASLTFQNLTVTNPHVNGPDPSYGDSAAVDVIRGGGGTVPLGNVHYLNINVAVTNGKVDHYFNFQDGSNVGITNVQFVPGTLSGATQVPPNGLLQGAGYNSIP